MNRLRGRVALLALPCVGFAVGLGCLGEAEHAFFDDRLDGSSDGTVAHVEASSGVDASVEDGRVETPGDEGAADDGGSDAVVLGDADAADSFPADGGLETGADASRGDAGGVDAGSDCGVPNTTANCAACGNACDKTHSSTPTCNGTTCSYGGCDAGWGDCVKTAPNVDGCETRLNTVTHCAGCAACDTTTSVGPFCNGTACSYSSCQAGFADCDTTPPNTNGCETALSAIVHSTGVPGLSYYDCAPLKTYTNKTAAEACAAYTGDASECVTYQCQDPTLGPIVCSSGNLTKGCACWDYGGKGAGYLDISGKPTQANSCLCPALGADPTWN